MLLSNKIQFGTSGGANVCFVVHGIRGIQDNKIRLRKTVFFHGQDMASSLNQGPFRGPFHMPTVSSLGDLNRDPT